MKKTVHIVIQGGLVQEVYTDKDADIEVVILDLDSTDANERELDMDVAMLKKTTKQIY